MIDLLRFIEAEVEVHQEKILKGEDDDGSYAGAYLREIESAKSEGRDTPLHLYHLKANIVELFIGGSETTSSTLWWGIYLLATNMDVQRKIQEELDAIIGLDNLPTLRDMDRLPYTNAAIFEVMRLGDLIPMSVPHRTTQDTVLEGYRIPKDTFVFLNLTRCLKGKEFWERPDKFYPEHFLTPDGKLYKPDAFMPFGTGKRVCLGESLARLELFLFFATLVHRFTWSLSNDPVT
ncbi:Cytochrome P450 2D6, partial [Halocaridina rubra]